LDWSVIFDTDLVGDDFESIEIHNDTLYVAHLQYNADTTLFGLAMMRYDSNGYFIDSFQRFDPIKQILSTYFYFSGMVIHDNHLFFCGTTVGDQVYVIKANLDFTEDTIFFYQPNSYAVTMGATEILATDDGLYVLAQEQKTNYDLDIVLIKSDFDGNEEWRKVYGTNFDELGLSLIEFQDGVLIGGARGYSNIINNTDNWNRELLIWVDTEGNIEREWLSNAGIHRSAVVGLQVVEDKYIYGGAAVTYVWQDAKAKKQIISRDTSDLSLNWQVECPAPDDYWGSGFLNLALSPDSTKITGVSLYTPDGISASYTVNIETGTLEFYRQLKGCTPLYKSLNSTLFDVAYLSSGSTVACGYTILNTPLGGAYTGWMVKTNPLGANWLLPCTTVDIGEVELPVYTGVEIIISPNPASSIVRLELPAVKQQQVSIRMIDLSGRVVYQESCQLASPEIDVSGMSEGLYFVQVVTQEGNVLAVGRVVVAR
jgi:Secretion system C-terminal sorting domain